MQLFYGEILQTRSHPQNQRHASLSLQCDKELNSLLFLRARLEIEEEKQAIITRDNQAI
jgi:hypothetical protein